MPRRTGALAGSGAVAVLGALTLTGCAGTDTTATAGTAPVVVQSSHTGTYRGWPLDPPRPRPSFTLTDTHNKPFSMAAETSGHPTLLYFGYTRCPDVCPTTFADIHTALTRLSAEQQKRIYVVFVTTDVKHDTPPVIAQWLANFDKGVSATFVGLTGTQSQINAAEAAAHIPISSDGGQTHSAQVLLYGTDDYARVKFIQATDAADQMAHDIPLVS